MTYLILDSRVKNNYTKNMDADKIEKTGNLVSRLFLGDTRELLVRIEEKVKNIDKDTNEIKTDIKDLRLRVSKLEGATTEVQGYFMRAGYPILQQLAISSSSPLKLTEYGEELAKKVMPIILLKPIKIFSSIL